MATARTTKTNEEKLAAKRAESLDEGDVLEIIWPNDTEPPSDRQAMARVFEHLLNPEDLVQDEIGDWLARLALRGLDMAAVRTALEGKVGSMVRRQAAKARKEHAKEPPGAAKAGGKSVLSSLADETTIVSALRRLEANKPGGLHSIARELRPLCRLEHDAFDRALLALGRRGSVVLHHTDLPRSLSPEDRAGAVQADGHTFIGAALAR